MWKLVDSKTGEELDVGSETTTFRGESCVIDDLCPPHKPSSTGKVYVMFPDIDNPQGFFPSVIGAKFIEA